MLDVERLIECLPGSCIHVTPCPLFLSAFLQVVLLNVGCSMLDVERLIECLPGSCIHVTALTPFSVRFPTGGFIERWMFNVGC